MMMPSGDFLIFIYFFSFKEGASKSCSSSACKSCLDSCDSCDQCGLCTLCLGSKMWVTRIFMIGGTDFTKYNSDLKEKAPSLIVYRNSFISSYNGEWGYLEKVHIPINSNLCLLIICILAPRIWGNSSDCEVVTH